MRNYTSGPWSVFVCGDAPGIEATEVNTSVIVFGTEEDNAGVSGRTLDEQMANAHLIAAAPELYEALKGLVSCIQRGSETYGDDIAKAIRAIQKAEGAEN